MAVKPFCITFIFIISIFRTSLASEWFTAISELENLLLLEHKLARPYAKFIKLEEQRLKELEEFVEEVETALPEITHAKVINYVGSPYNSYKVLSRFVHVWERIAKFSSKNFTGGAIDELTTMLTKYRDQMPADEDVHGAIEALFRLQDTYHVNPAQLADGMGPKAHKLGVEELFELGFIATGQADYYHAKHYFMEASRRFNSKASKIGFLDRESLLEYLGWAQFQLGEIDGAIETTELILQYNPKHESARVNLAAYREQLKAYKKNPFKPRIKTSNETWRDEFDSRCRGDWVPMNKKLNKFHCDYHSISPSTILKPFKRQRVCSSPDIWVFKNVVSLYEINLIKQLSRPKLARATVFNPKDGKLMYANYRTSKSAWLREEENPVVANIISRVGRMTGLDMRFSEPLQVVNYGVGGHYATHTDHATENFSEVFELGWGNRIATALLYLSDVMEGGETVFVDSKEGCRIQPHRGDVVFWYNLKRNGKGDARTRHAACPVFIGNKWVANLWIHEYGQEFIRKCSKLEDE